MPLPSSGALSMSQINAEFGRGNNLNAYRGTTYYTSSAGPFTFPSGAISFSNFYGTQLASPVGTFSPDGGTTAGNRVFLSGYSEGGTASVTVTCTLSATWNYTRDSGSFGSANVASGGSATSITFSMTTGTGFRHSVWSMNATSGSNTRFWLIDLFTINNSCTRCCFTPDTLISMADGSYKRIDEISIGDFILSYSEEFKTNVAVPVESIIIRDNNVMYEYNFADGSKVNASEDHPLYVVGKGYASMNPVGEYKDIGVPKQIAEGDYVVNEAGTPNRIISIKPIDYSDTVYTFSNSRFYANNVLVY